MKTICPCCQSTAVYEMTDGLSINLIDQLLSPELVCVRRLRFILL